MKAKREQRKITSDAMELEKQHLQQQLEGCGDDHSPAAPNRAARAGDDHASSSAAPRGMSLICSRSKLGLDFIARLQTQLGGIGLADEQVAVELDLGGVAELTPRPALAAAAA